MDTAEVLPWEGSAMTDRLGEGATWAEYVAAHGGDDVPGYWVLLWWESGIEAVGPYVSESVADAALQDSPLICGIAESTRNPEVLDDVTLHDGPLTIAQALARFLLRVTLIDPGDPMHYAGGE